MAFTVNDYNDLIRLLAEHPEWRPDLRRLVLSDDLLSLPEVVRELAEAQRRTEQRVEELAEAQRRTEQRIEELAQAQQRTEHRVEEMAEAIGKMAAALQTLEKRVWDLSIETREMRDDLGFLKGRILEDDYRKKIGSYFGPMIKRPKIIDPTELEETLSSSLSPEEHNEVLRLDLLIKGLSRIDDREVWLAIEVSFVVDETDLERAAQRAALLRRAGIRAVPVAAGLGAVLDLREKARSRKVALMQDGYVIGWDDALQS